MSLTDVIMKAAEYQTTKRNQALHKHDFEAWLWDVLGERMWSKQREVAESVQVNTHTMVKSANGTGKSFVASRIVTWFATVNDPVHTRILLTAPINDQIDQILFSNLRDAFEKAEQNGIQLPGRITLEPKWVVEEPRRIDLVVPKRPADQNLLSSFQGIHAENVLVVMEEAGGLHEDLFVAAEAVTTNEYARILAIANPDRLHTGFHRRYINEKRFPEWNRVTISAFDTPNFTGEIVYPGEPEKEQRARATLPSKAWVERNLRSMHPSVAQAKIYGEFPEEGDDTLFNAEVIERACNTEIDPSAVEWTVLGVDLAFGGGDLSVAYLNRGGHLRRIHEWNKDDHLVSADIIHDLAVRHGVNEVRVDATGEGGGVPKILLGLPKYAGAPYLVRSIKGAEKSPDPARWLNARAHHYDSFRELMRDGLLDIDLSDKELIEQMESQMFKFTAKSQLQILSKAEMRSKGIKSPDHLDAAIYASFDADAYEEKVSGKIYTDPSAYTMADFQQDLPNYIRAWTDTW